VERVPTEFRIWDVGGTRPYRVSNEPLSNWNRVHWHNEPIF
jgi:hypothetical protein